MPDGTPIAATVRGMPGGTNGRPSSIRSRRVRSLTYRPRPDGHGSPTSRTNQAGHFMAEEAPEDIAALVLDLMKR